jgi:hypothetical protein
MAYGVVNADKMTTSDGVSSSGLYGFKNRIINGAMVIDQRNAGASVTPTASAYTLDRWEAGLSVTSKFSVQRSTTAPSGFINSLLVTSTSAYTVGAGEIFVLTQFIEGYNVADMGFGTANASTFTLSFWVRSSLTGTFGGSLQNSGRTRSYPFTYTISSANTWEQKSITVTGDTTGTWLTDNGRGLNVIFSLGAGSTFSGTANAWATANYYSATSATSVVATNGATFYITGVQLEKGSTATSFDYRPYGTELALCQRYYESGFMTCTSYTNAANSTTAAGKFQVSKRATPTMSSSVNATYSEINASNGTPVILSNNTTDVYVDWAGSTAGFTRMSRNFFASAEL